MTDSRTLKWSDRLLGLPPYMFAKIDELKRQELAKGKKLLSVGVGDPDLPMPEEIQERLIAGVRKPPNHMYPSYWGTIEFRQAAARFMEKRFGVAARAEDQVLTLIGSKEGIAHLPLALVNPGEGVLVPDPGYPVYASATLFAGGMPIPLPLREKNAFLPDFAEMESLVKKGPRVRLLFLNYPCNPTGSMAPLAFFEELVRFARKHEIVVCHDNAYSEIYFAEAPVSFLQAKGAWDVGIETHSLSKSFNMAGGRLGFAVGNEKIIKALAQVKTNIDSGAFNAVQEAGSFALDHFERFTLPIRETYRRRRDILLPAVTAAGLRPMQCDATFYLWCGLPPGVQAMPYVMDLIQKRGVVAMPGTGFGAAGEGFVRLALCADEAVLKQVAQILAQSL